MKDTNGATGLLLPAVSNDAGRRRVWHAAARANRGGRGAFSFWIALPPELSLGPSESIYLSRRSFPTMGRPVSSSAATDRDQRNQSPVADELSRRAFEGWRTLELPAARGTLSSGPPWDGFRFWSQTSCGRANWWPSGLRAPRSNSRPNPMQRWFLARLCRMITTLCWAPFRAHYKHRGATEAEARSRPSDAPDSAGQTLSNKEGGDDREGRKPRKDRANDRACNLRRSRTHPRKSPRPSRS